MKAVNLAGVFMLAALMSRAAPAAGPPPVSAATAAPLATPFRWTTDLPVSRAALADGGDWLSVKDPSIVRHGEAWDPDSLPAFSCTLTQGALDADRQGKPCGRIPWRLGLLEFRP